MQPHCLQMSKLALPLQVLKIYLFILSPTKKKGIRNLGRSKLT